MKFFPCILGIFPLEAPFLCFELSFLKHSSENLGNDYSYPQLKLRFQLMKYGTLYISVFCKNDFLL